MHPLIKKIVVANVVALGTGIGGPVVGIIAGVAARSWLPEASSSDHTAIADATPTEHLHHPDVFTSMFGFGSDG